MTFSSAGSSDPEGGTLTYSWAFGDGTTSTAANPTKTYTANGTYTATLTVRDPQGATGTSSVVISVGNTAPTVTINLPSSGQLVSFGDSVPWSVTVTDPEDGAINCSRVTMAYALGHDQHAHQITSQTGCSGTITIPVDGEHDDAANIFPIFDASYTDNGGLNVHAQNILQPRKRQAEHYKTAQGVALMTKATADGGRTVGDIHNGDWIQFDPYKLNNATSFSARVSSAAHRRHPPVPHGFPHRHDHRPGDRRPDRRLGDLRQRHRHDLRSARGHHLALPDLRRHGHRSPVRPGHLHLHDRHPAGAAAGSPGSAASAWTCAAAPPPTAPRSRSTRATARRRRRGPGPARPSGPRQVPGRLGRQHRQRRQDPDLHVQRHQRPELDRAVGRHDPQRRIGQVPRRDG